MDVNNQEFIGRVLDVVETNIVPLTRQGVALGDKVFGAAILRKEDLSLVIGTVTDKIHNIFND